MGNKFVNYDKQICFSYEYIDLGDTDYHFHQRCFDNYDIKHYFIKTKEYSPQTLNQLLDNLPYTDHFKIGSPPPVIKDLIETIAKRKLGWDEIPTVGHFALYTNKNEGDRAVGRKSPRIHFFVGKTATLHVLFYDPYHELHSKK